MDKKIFFILEGNNGATYIFNALNLNTLKNSLRFYKARTFKQKVMKNALKLYLNTLGTACKVFNLNTLKDKKTIAKYLEALTEQTIDFELDENISILISPTRDKIIVHHHDNYFHKFAFGNSYKNVKNEASIYTLLDRPLEHFKVSKFYDYVDNENTFCSFKLSSQGKRVKTDNDLTSALVEMFSVTKQDKYLFTTYLNDLKNRYVKSNIVNESIVRVLKELKDTYKDVFISLGLIHRDFKPWNINDEQGLLIYDFEEAVTDGPPLEDLFNYFIDPIVRYVDCSGVSKLIFKPDNVSNYKRYLQELDIQIDYQILLYCYLIERAIFWKESNEIETSEKYCTLFEQIAREFQNNG